MPKYVITDTETSCLFDFSKPADAPGQPRACSVALLFVDEALELIEERYNLIKPDGWALDPESEAAQKNGLTQEQLERDGVPIAEVLAPYTHAIDERYIVVGHNVLFDTKMMRAEMRHAGIDDRYMKTRTICTMFGSRKICNIPNTNGKKGIKNPKLEEACEVLGIPLPEAHNALHDARACLGILRKARDLGQMPDVKDPYDKKPK